MKDYISPFILYHVHGNSMEPLYPDNCVVFAVKFWFTKPKIGDSIIGRDPRNGMLLLKKITKISDNKFFIIGENRKKSTDSEQFGYVNRESIIAKVLFRI